MFKFIEAVFILSGMIIGVGMFGIPFSFASSGFLLGAIELLIITVVTLVLNLTYSEIVLKTPSLHRLPGYIKIYLGHFGSYIAFLTTLLGISGALLAYIIVGSFFLHNILISFGANTSEFFIAAVFVVAGALITAFPLGKETLVNGVLTAILIIFILLLVAALLPKVYAINLTGFHLRQLFAPYGVLLFALSGGVVVPDLITFLGRKRDLARRAIISGTLVAASLYFLFAFAVVGVLGTNVGEEAIGDLGKVTGQPFILLGSLIGFLAVFTSFISLNSSVKSMLQLDLNFSKNLSWFLASFFPFFLYTFGFKSFIGVISLVGAVSVGVEAGLIITAYHKMKSGEVSHFSLFSYFWKFLIYIMIAAGVIYELSYLYF